MNILMSSLLGVATFVLHVSTSEESVEISVWPPVSNIYLGECVLLQCRVKSRSTFVKSYQWCRSKAYNASNPRHLVSGDSYFITAVTMEDEDMYWCQPESQDNKTFSSSQMLKLNVSKLPPSSVTRRTRQMFSGEHLWEAGWKLKHFSPDCTEIKTSSCSSLDSAITIENVTQEDEGLYNSTVGTVTVQYLPLRGAVSADKSKASVSITANSSSGQYWCENTEGRSNAVNITVSYGKIILKTPAFSVFKGDKVVLYCQYQTGNHNKTTFFKNGKEIDTSSSFNSEGVTKMTIENVTQEDEGFYKCVSQDKKMESPESWLSVRSDRGNFTSMDGTPASSSGSWKWIVVSCGVVFLFLITLTVWLVCHYRYQTFCTRRFWPVFKQDVPAVALPATKQDVTEVQWDLSWMEMSSLLDK